MLVSILEHLHVKKWPIWIGLLGLYLICSIPLYAQKRAPDPEDLPSKEPFIQKSENPGYLLVVNTSKNFGFEIPKGWDATHNGAKTDGYYVIPDSSGNKENIVIAISRAPLIGTNEGFLTMLDAQYGDREPYTLIDGSTGYHFQNAGKHTEVFARLGTSMRLILTIEAPDAWRLKHRKQILHLAKSIQFKQFNIQR